MRINLSSQLYSMSNTKIVKTGKQSFEVEDASVIDPSLPLRLELNDSFSYKWPGLIQSIDGNTITLKYTLPDLPIVGSDAQSITSFSIEAI